MMRRFLLPFALLAPTAAQAQNAPFCVVSGAGTQCYYWNAPSCQSAARSMQGMCVVNQQQQQSPQSIPNYYESWTRAREDGARRAEQQRTPVGTAAPTATSKEGFSWDDFVKDLAYRQQMRGPIYDCGNGPTPVAAEGCTVTGFERDL